MRLRDLGSTLIVVEHDEDTIRMADWVVDVGPGPVSTVVRSSCQEPLTNCWPVRGP
ncbi:excinuclease ABC subunit A [Cutibacterium acnes JCM 18918]|nr:excinuclease ABC subunit A [Cutibacterium acnes JCM 18918]